MLTKDLMVTDYTRKVGQYSLVNWEVHKVDLVMGFSTGRLGWLTQTSLIAGGGLTLLD